MSDLRKARAAKPLDVKVPCAVCGFQEPLATAHDHHVTPRAFGGTDDTGNRVWLCASCHARLHRIQEFIVQGKQASAYELCASIFPSNAGARSKLWSFANEAAAAEKEVEGVFDSHRTTTKVSFVIDKDVWERIKGVAKEKKVSAAVMAAEILKRSV